MAKVKQERRLPYAPAPEVIFEGDTVNTQRYDDVYYEHEVGKISRVEREGTQSFVVHGSEQVSLRIEVWNDDTVRFFYAFGKEAEDFSYARDPDAHPTPATVTVTDDAGTYAISTATLVVTIQLEDTLISIADRQGTVLHQLATPFYSRYTLMQGLEQMRLQFTTSETEAFYGLGDKAWDTNLRGRCFENWNNDSFAYGRERDALYRTIPFFYGLREGLAYGLFLDNSYRSHFDFDSNRDGLTTVWTDGGEFDYYFINGPRLDEVAAPLRDPYRPARGCRPSGRWATTSAAGATTPSRGSRSWRLTSGRKRFPATPSTSTLTTWTGTAASPGTRSTSPSRSA